MRPWTWPWTWLASCWLHIRARLQPAPPYPGHADENRNRGVKTAKLNTAQVPTSCGAARSSRNEAAGVAKLPYPTTKILSAKY